MSEQPVESGNEYAYDVIDEVARTVTSYGLQGKVIGTRPFTAEENRQADENRNTASLRTDARAQIEIMLASLASIQAVVDKANNQITPADTKTVARELRRTVRQMIRLTRLVVGALDSANSGSGD